MIEYILGAVILYCIQKMIKDVKVKIIIQKDNDEDSDNMNPITGYRVTADTISIIANRLNRLESQLQLEDISKLKQ